MLFQVHFLSLLLEERGAGDMAEVAEHCRAKLIRRHPHVFGDTAAETAGEVLRNWDAIKRDEPGREDGIFGDVPENLPALLHARKVQRRAASSGFDFPGVEGPLLGVEAELGELTEAVAAAGEDAEAGATAPDDVRDALFHEVGDVLFAAVNVARKLRVDPELALRVRERPVPRAHRGAPSASRAERRPRLGGAARRPQALLLRPSEVERPMSSIEKVHARQILDSRGNPTVEVELALRSGATGRAAVPSGASTGEFEATELRDGGAAFGGKGVTKAVGNVNGEIAETVTGRDATDQEGLDRALIDLDGTPNKSRLGANAILGVSLAAAHAAAAEEGLPLWRYLGGDAAHILPVPMMNVLNGGAHADNKVDFQEFMVVPVGAPSFSRGAAHRRRGLPRAEEDAARPGPRHRRWATRAASRPTSAPTRRPCRCSSRASRPRATRPGEDVAIALDPATSEIFKDGAYVLEARGPLAAARTRWPPTGPSSPAATRSSRSRTAWTRRTGTAGAR